MNQPIAVVGIACRHPDANSPAELWEVVLAGRRAFRRIPDERLRLEDYWSPDPAAPDKFHAPGRRQRDHQKDSGSYRDAPSGSPADNPARSYGREGEDLCISGGPQNA